QQDRQIQAVRRRLARKVLTTVKEMPDDRRAAAWAEFGRAPKEGVLEGPVNRALLLDIISVPSPADGGKPAPRRGACCGTKAGQKDISYVTGESRATIENSPHIEAFRGRGVEVLLLTDPIDELWVEQVAEFDGHPLRSIAKGQVDLSTEDERDTAEAEREQ